MHEALRIAYVVLAVLSLCFLAVVVRYGLRIDATRRAQYGAEDDQIEHLRQSLSDDQLIVTAASLGYYAFAGAVMSIGAVAGRKLPWRLALGIATAGCVGMAIWSLLLSGAISFDEVYPAWIVFTLLLAGLGVAGFASGAAQADDRAA